MRTIVSSRRVWGLQTRNDYVAVDMVYSRVSFYFHGGQAEQDLVTTTSECYVLCGYVHTRAGVQWRNVQDNDTRVTNCEKC